MMEKCPAEVLHQICSLVGPTAAAALRLSCKSNAIVAEHYVVRGRIRFHISPESLQRLEFIANHPIFSQHVTKVYYEANILLPILSAVAYGKHLNAGPVEAPPRRPSEPCSSREMRLYERNMEKWRQGGPLPSPKKIQDHYEKYVKAYEEQQKVLKDRLDIKILRGAMVRFPRLSEVYVVNVGRCKHGISGRFWERFPEGFRPPMSYDTQITTRQLDSILRPLRNSTLRVLEAKVITPKILTELSLRTSIKHCFANLHKVFLAFRLADFEYDEEGWDEPSDLYLPVRKGHLFEVLSQATQLRSLSIHFDECCSHPHSFAKLTDILGTQSWPELDLLDLSRFECTEEELIKGLKRQPSLKILELACITLTSGSWINVLFMMRKELNLDMTDFQGWFRNTGSPEEFMTMDHVDVDAFMDDPECVTTLSSAIDTYLTFETDEEDYDRFLNPAENLVNYEDLDELQSELGVEPTDSEFDLIMNGMF